MNILVTGKTVFIGTVLRQSTSEVTFTKAIWVTHTAKTVEQLLSKGLDEDDDFRPVDWAEEFTVPRSWVHAWPRAVPAARFTPEWKHDDRAVQRADRVLRWAEQFEALATSTADAVTPIMEKFRKVYNLGPNWGRGL